MAAILFLLLLVLPIAELYVIIQIGQEIGAGWTIALLIAISIMGAKLLKQQGGATWRRLQAALARGEMPTAEVTDGALILLGGALLLTPGFITDAVGILLLLPPTRAAMKGLARNALRTVAFGRFGMAGETGKRIYEARVVRSRRGGVSPAAPGERPPLSEGRRADEGDSPDRG